MNPFKFLIKILRLPLDLVMWVVDFFRVTRFVFSVQQKVSERCPFGCYRNGNIVKPGLRKCPAAGRYGNFWLFRTLCRCARKPTEKIAGVPAFCRERGSFEISFRRWATILMLSTAAVGTAVYSVASGFVADQFETAAEVASPETFRALREVARPEPRSRPQRPQRAETDQPEVRVDAAAVPSGEEPLRNAVKQALTTPDNAAVRVRLARGYRAIGEMATARQILWQSFKENADHEALTYWVLYEVLDGRAKIAEEELRKAFPDGEVPATVLPAAFLAAHEAGGAKLAKTRLAELADRDDELTRLVLAVAAQAALSAEQFVELAREFPDLAPLFELMLEAGDDKSAVTRLAAVAMDEKAAGALRGNAAWRLWQRDQRDLAMREAERIVRRHPEVATAQRVRIEGYLAAGLTGRAATVARATLPLVEDAGEKQAVRRLLARALQRAGDRAAALTVWRQVRAGGADAEADAAIKALLAGGDGEP